MYTFTLERPATLDAAAALAGAGGKPLAGGQTLLASMKLRLASPEQLVDLGQISGLAGVTVQGDRLRIGAMTRHNVVAGNADVCRLCPALAELAGQIGDRQVRAMGTLGGSLANNDPSACYPSAVLALGATVHTTRRQIAADDYFQGMFSTALEEGELIAAVEFPSVQRAAYVKFRQPASRFALIGVFVAQTPGGVRVAVTGGGNGVFRHAGLEGALSAAFTPEAAAAVRVSDEGLNADLHASAAYRAQLISVMAQRAVAAALAR